MTLAPIAVFAYRRPGHLQRCLESLAGAELASQSDLHIFCDGPRTDADASAVEEVRSVASHAAGFRSVSIIAQEQNRGLAASIIAGVTALCERSGRVIVVEDDLVMAPCFLRFMNDALDRYEEDDQVMQIAGYAFPVDATFSTKAVFLPFISSWGWATWHRAWQHFDSAMKGYDLLKASAHRRYKFDLDGSYDYFAMLERQLRGEIDSWAIRWHLSCFLRHGLTLYPGITLVHNLGFDGTGTHAGSNSEYLPAVRFPGADHRFLLPSELRVEPSAYRQVKRVLRPTAARRGLFRRVANLWS